MSHLPQAENNFHNMYEFENNWSIFAPIVLERGSTYLDSSVQPILNQIQSWTRNNIGKPIVLLGTSNGGRIVLELSNRLKNDCPILVISLAGAIGGSGLLSFGKKLGLAKYLVQTPVYEELTVNSVRVQKLISDARQRASIGNICYIFIGSSFDHLLLQSSLAFPNLTDRAEIVKNILLTRAGHSGIVTLSLPIIKFLLNEWLENGTIINLNCVNFPGVIEHAK